jgi:hypothetical protein
MQGSEELIPRVNVRLYGGEYEKDTVFSIPGGAGRGRLRLAGKAGGSAL